MKKYFGYILTILILLCIFLFLVLLYQGQKEQLLSVNFSPYTKKLNEQSSKFKEADIGDVIIIEEELMLPSFPISLKYHNHNMTFTYFLVKRDNVEVHSGPSCSETVIKEIPQKQKLSYIETILTKTGKDTLDRWYHVAWNEEGETLFGFVDSGDVIKRVFQFDKMEKAVNLAREYADRGKLTYINNYKNQMGYAPFYYGKTVDKLGNERNQSAPGYETLSNLQEFVYIEDGTLVRYLFTAGDYVKVQLLSTGKTYFIPSKYIADEQIANSLKKAVVIDCTNQNEAVYENIEGVWTLVSYTLATTGKAGEYSQSTSLGYFYAIERKEQLLYYEDDSCQIREYAPYAIRFNGDVYIHGVASNFEYNEKGQRVASPAKEFSESIGTVPLFHKRVRNYTSHAKFLYEWYSPNETIFIVIE